MDLLLALIISFVLLVFSVLNGYFIVYPLFISLLVFIVVLLNRGFKLRILIDLAFLGSKKSFSILIILLLIGGVTAVWMASGTVPAIVYYGMKLIRPQYFILSAFILTSFISTLIGTSFGTVSTIGIALMIMAKGSGVNSNIIAGAIIAGAYFGDRCSPMSSSAHLIASITRTELYTNLKNMVVTAFLPLVVSIVFYWILSRLNPVEITDRTLLSEIPRCFSVSFIVLLPALAILLLSVFRVEVKLSMSISIIIGIFIAITFQGYSWLQLLRFMLLGFTLEETTPLKSIISGGGIISMVKVSIVVIVSTALAGIFAGTKTLETIEVFVKKTRSRSGLFLGTIAIGLASAAFGCTQTIAILLTQQLVQEKYQEEQLDNYQLAADLENTVVVLSPLIPWNIAGLVPATLLMTGSGFIPYAFYLYLIPLLNLVQFKLSESPKRRLG
jgi:NhaC family Na+:H+ antiporter